MSHRVFKVRCPDGPCGREFSIRVSIELSGKRIKIECPGCVGKFAVSIPAVPVDPPSDDHREPEPKRPTFDSDAFDDLMKTLEGFNIAEIFGPPKNGKGIH